MSENIERPPLGVKPRYLAAEEAWEMYQQASMRPV